MSVLIAFIALFGLALILGAALAYPMYLLLTNWFELDIESATNRCVLLVSIILFITLYRKLNFGAYKDIGYSKAHKEFWHGFAKGFVIGVLIMGPVIIGLLISGNRLIDPGWQWQVSNLLPMLLKAVLAGLIVAFIEETIFRGAMLTAVQRKSSATFAVITTSLFYALLHFLKPGIDQNPDTLDWVSGFMVLKNAFLTLLQPMHFIDSFMALFFAGVLLAIIKIRTNRLAYCIGVHAAWVVAISMFKRVTNTNHTSEYAFLSGDYDRVIGYLATVSIVITILVFIMIKNNLRSN